MSKSDQKIVVVNNDYLFGKERSEYFQGFRLKEEVDYENRILNNLEIMRRGSDKEPKDHKEGNAELNFDFKQPIGYMMVVNPDTKKVFAFQRSSKDKHYGESRLQGKWSWGVGGHIEPIDTKYGNPIVESRLRELEEEVYINGKIKSVNVLGYINDDMDSVGKVHFGILYLIEINGNVSPKDNEMARGEMLSINELEEICSSDKVEVENWSRIALDALKKYFSK